MWDSYIEDLKETYNADLVEFISKSETLKYLYENSILEISESVTNGISIFEGCDGWFSVPLDKKICNQISDTFRELSKFLEK